MADMTAVSAGTTTNPEHLLPPGFRFHPTDEELILHYLRNRASALPIPVSIIAEVDIYKFDPWELPAKAVFGDREWYFFSPRDRKYPNGVRPNRAAGSGYWKATGTDKPILLTGTTAGRTESIGVKKALVFYKGKPPKGNKTNWIMHEYRLPESAGRNNTPAVARRLFEQHQQFLTGNANDKPAQLQSKDSSSSMRLDDWVLCRIYEKAYNNNNTHSTCHQQQSAGSTLEPDRCADGDLDMEDSSNNYIPSPFVQRATNTSPSTATLSHQHQQLQQIEQEPDHFYRSLPKAASLSDLLAETDLSIVSRLLYETPMPPPPDVAAVQPPQHLTADPPATASHQWTNLHSVNAVAAPNLTLTNNKRQMLRPETGSLLQQLIESKKPRHASSGFTGLQVTQPSAYDNIMNGCTTFTPSTCNLTAAGAGFVNTTTSAHPLLSDVVPHPQLTMMTTSVINNASTTNQQYMMSRLHQPPLQMQFLNADYNGSVKLH